MNELTMDKMQFFSNKEFKVRVVSRLAEPWFVAKDVADCIGHSDTSAMCKLCREKDKVVVRANDLTSDELSDVKNREYTLISESGLYRILAKCNLPKCEPFESWVFDEVLPSIRKNGSYGKIQTVHDMINDPDTAIEMLTQIKILNLQNQQLEMQNQQLEKERDTAIRTKTLYQEGLASQMSGRVGGLTSALNRVKAENDRLKGDRLTVDDVYIIMNTNDVSFTVKDVKDVIRGSLKIISSVINEPFPKLPVQQKEIKGKMEDIRAFVFTRKTVQTFFEFVENNPIGWQARNRKMILYGWLHGKMKLPA